MKTYVCPLYNIDKIESNDIILASGNVNAVIEEVDKTSARVTADVSQVLGFKYF